MVRIMAIKYLSGKRATALKSDIFSDSLGSSADGTNSGITSTRIKVNTTTNKVEYIGTRNGTWHALSYDLGSTVSNTAWVLRARIKITSLSAGNQSWFVMGLSKLSSATDISWESSGVATDTCMLGIMYESSNKRFGTVGGYNRKVPNFMGYDTLGFTPSTDTYYYVELKRTSDANATFTMYSDSTFSTVVQTKSTTSNLASASGLRYLHFSTPKDNATGGAFDVEIDQITIDDDTTTFSSADYTVNPNSTTGWTGQYKLGTGAYSFDGTDDYVKISNDLDAIVSGDFSVAGWVYFDNADTGTTHETILRKASGSSYSSPYHDFFLYQYNTGVNLTVNDGSTYQTLTGTAGTSTVGWHHVCVTRASNVYTLYVDGTSNGTLSHTTSFGTQPWYFGCSENGTGTFERELYGKLDDWGCWSRVLTATEIGKLYNNNGGYQGTLTNGSGFTISGNTATRSSSSANSYCYGATSLNVGSYIVYKINGSTVYTSTNVNSGTVYPYASSYDNGNICKLTATKDGTKTTLTWTFTEGSNGTLNGLGCGVHTGTSAPTSDPANWESLYAQFVLDGHSNNVKIKEGGTMRDSDTGVGYTAGMTFSMEFTDSSSAVTDASAQLVSSLSDKANLKANYTMDSTDSGDTWWTGGSSNNASIDGNNISPDGGSAWANWALGSAITKPYKLIFSTANTNKNVFMGFGDGATPSDSGGVSALGYAMYLTSGGDVYWSDSTGADNDTGTNRASGDIYQVEWTSGNNVTLSVNGSVVKTWSNISETTLYPYWQAYGDSGLVTATGICKNDYSDASPIANLPAGSIMEVTDDGNHYIWNATTSTWTVVS